MSEIVEDVARAIAKGDQLLHGGDAGFAGFDDFASDYADDYKKYVAIPAIAAATPHIRAAVIEEIATRIEKIESSTTPGGKWQDSTIGWLIRSWADEQENTQP